MIVRNINNCKQCDFYNLPFLESSKQTLVKSLVLLPTRNLHDSGFKMFSVAVVDLFGNLLGRITLNDYFSFHKVKHGNIDLLKCGLFRIQFNELLSLSSVFHYIKGVDL